MNIRVKTLILYLLYTFKLYIIYNFFLLIINMQNILLQLFCNTINEVCIKILSVKIVFNALKKFMENKCFLIAVEWVVFKRHI
jgi:hypothetical protein